MLAARTATVSSFPCGPPRCHRFARVPFSLTLGVGVFSTPFLPSVSFGERPVMATPSAPSSPRGSPATGLPPATQGDVPMDDAGSGRIDAGPALPAEVPAPPLADSEGPGPFGEILAFSKEWPYPHSLPCVVTDRWVHVDPRRMAAVWTTFRHLYPDLYEVPIGTPTDYLVLRFAEEWKLARQMEEACDRPPLGEGAMPVFDLAYYPGSLPAIGERPRGALPAPSAGRAPASTTLWHFCLCGAAGGRRLHS